MALEEQGLPTLAVHTHVFARLCRSTALAMGMPRLRQAYVPQPVVDRSAADLRAYIEGQDPISKRPSTFERTTPRLLAPDAEDSLHRLFEESGWTDHLPIVLPTEARVEAMLKGTSHPPDTVVGRLRPTTFREAWEFTVE